MTYIGKIKPENAGKSWSSDEDRQLIREFKLGINLNEICKTHKRTIGGIRTRLVRLELINDIKDIGYYYAKLNSTSFTKSSIIKQKTPSDNQTKYIELQNNVKEIKCDIKELKESLQQLTSMLKAIYEFEDEQLHN